MVLDNPTFSQYDFIAKDKWYMLKGKTPMLSITRALSICIMTDLCSNRAATDVQSRCLMHAMLQKQLSCQVLLIMSIRMLTYVIVYLLNFIFYLPIHHINQCHSFNNCPLSYLNSPPSRLSLRGLISCFNSDTAVYIIYYCISLC